MRRGAEKDSERKTNSMFQANCNFLSPIFGPFRAPSKPSFYLKQGEAPVHLTVHNFWWWNFHSPLLIRAKERPLGSETAGLEIVVFKCDISAK
jgi:hypothetical protein